MHGRLAAKEANFRVLAEGSSDIVGRPSLDLRVQYASPSTVRIVGWSPDQLVGNDALAGVNPEDLPLVQHTIAALKRGEIEEGRLTYRTRHREKTEIWMETSMRPTRAASGEIDGFIVVSRDITRQKDLRGSVNGYAGRCAGPPCPMSTTQPPIWSPRASAARRGGRGLTDRLSRRP